jgi:hypothetical protein
MIAINLNEKELRAISWLVIDAKENIRKDLSVSATKENILELSKLMTRESMLENVIEVLNHTIANVNELTLEPKLLAFDKWLAVKEGN